MQAPTEPVIVSPATPEKTYWIPTPPEGVTIGKPWTGAAPARRAAATQAARRAAGNTCTAVDKAFAAAEAGDLPHIYLTVRPSTVGAGLYVCLYTDASGGCLYGENVIGEWSTPADLARLAVAQGHIPAHVLHFGGLTRPCGR